LFFILLAFRPPGFQNLGGLVLCIGLVYKIKISNITDGISLFISIFDSNSSFPR